jgi:hypothetical protein
MNINEIKIEPTSFRDTTTWYVICYKDGTIHQEFSTLDSALYMYDILQSIEFIQEVFKIRSKIISTGEIIKQKGDII